MGCCVSLNEKRSSMYKWEFIYKTKNIKMYRYIVYEGVKFQDSIIYDDDQTISKEVLYPLVINDMRTGKFLFTDEYDKPLMSTSSIKGQAKHTIHTNVSEIMDLFSDYFATRERPKIICSQFSYDDHRHPPPYNPDQTYN